MEFISTGIFMFIVLRTNNEISNDEQVKNSNFDEKTIDFIPLTLNTTSERKPYNKYTVPPLRVVPGWKR